MQRLALAIVVLTACASRPHCELPPRVTGAPPFLWRVQRDHGPPVWLFGTIHDAGEDEVPAAAKAALEHAKRFAAADGAFVAVGLGHLLGEGGLPQALARAGYAVSRVR